MPASIQVFKRENLPGGRESSMTTIISCVKLVKRNPKTKAKITYCNNNRFYFQSSVYNLTAWLSITSRHQ